MGETEISIRELQPQASSFKEMLENAQIISVSEADLLLENGKKFAHRLSSFPKSLSGVTRTDITIQQITDGDFFAELANSLGSSDYQMVQTGHERRDVALLNNAALIVDRKSDGLAGKTELWFRLYLAKIGKIDATTTLRSFGAIKEAKTGGFKKGVYVLEEQIPKNCFLDKWASMTDTERQSIFERIGDENSRLAISFLTLCKALSIFRSAKTPVNLDGRSEAHYVLRDIKTGSIVVWPNGSVQFRDFDQCLRLKKGVSQSYLNAAGFTSINELMRLCTYNFWYIGDNHWSKEDGSMRVMLYGNLPKNVVDFFGIWNQYLAPMFGQAVNNYPSTAQIEFPRSQDGQYIDFDFVKATVQLMQETGVWVESEQQAQTLASKWRNEPKVVIDEENKFGIIPLQYEKINIAKRHATLAITQEESNPPDEYRQEVIETRMPELILSFLNKKSGELNEEDIGKLRIIAETDLPSLTELNRNQLMTNIASGVRSLVGNLNRQDQIGQSDSFAHRIIITFLQDKQAIETFVRIAQWTSDPLVRGTRASTLLREELQNLLVGISMKKDEFTQEVVELINLFKEQGMGLIIEEYGGIKSV